MTAMISRNAPREPGTDGVQHTVDTRFGTITAMTEAPFVFYYASLEVPIIRV